MQVEGNSRLIIEGNLPRPIRSIPHTQAVWYAIAIAMTAHGLLITGAFVAGKWKRKVL